MGVFANKTELRVGIKALWAKAAVGLWERMKRVGEGNKSEDPGWQSETQSRLRWGRDWRTQTLGGEREAEKASKTSTVRILAIFRKLLCKVC